MNLIRNEELRGARHEYDLQEQLSGKRNLQELNNVIDNLTNTNEKLNNDITIQNQQLKDYVAEIKKLQELRTERNDIKNFEGDSNKLYKDEINELTQKLLQELSGMTRREKIIFSIILQLFHGRQAICF